MAKCRVLISTLLSGLLLVSHVQASGVADALMDIQERLHLEQDGRDIIPGSTIYEPMLVDAFYQARDYQPAWTDKDYAREMLQLLKSSEDEGLNPADYHYDELLDLQEKYQKAWSGKDGLHAQAEVLLTDGILLYAKHLQQGKVDPRTLDDTWNYAQLYLDPDKVAKQLAAAIAGKQVAQVIETIKPKWDFYVLMKQDFERYRKLAGNETFSVLPEDVVLHPGDKHANVVLLRQRLQQLSYMEAGEANSEQFDDQLKQAVQQLQSDYYLEADGIVGKQSYQILNLSFSDKVDKLRINMDRLRWMGEQESDDFILVNIASYELYYMRDRKLEWTTPVMVGKIRSKTPMFQARLRYMEFNPTWNTPRSLINIAKFKSDPQYIVDKGYKFYDANNNEVDPSSIDWDKYTKRSFPYRVVQMPGPKNAMGQVKFIFPNSHAIYMHDTPSRDLFSRQQRAFSAGCIRVKDPLTFARVLLDDQDKWSDDKIQSLVDSGKPKQVVRLDRDIDVMLMYWTVSPQLDNRLQFQHDVYDLDPAALAILDAPPKPTAFVQR
ncbi:MAG: L,D-transpeptidase family protein [Pseudomonadales bacterium]